MISKTTRNSILLLLASFLWGISFVAQSSGGDAIGPFTFNCVRSFIGALVLIPAFLLFDKLQPQTSKRPKTKQEKKQLWIAGICCGVILTISTNLQQMGMFWGASAGKSGFLTALYILFVPIIGLFLKRACGWNVWAGVMIALIGFYLLCVKEDFSIQPADLLLLLCAVVFSLHILMVDHFSPMVDGVRLSCIQFFTVGVLSFIPMVAFDIFHVSGSLSSWLFNFTSWDAWIPLLYSGLMSSGVAYTLQIIGQVGVNPSIAALLMSPESVFAGLAGWIIKGESFSRKEFIGCVLIFIAILLAQIPKNIFKRKK